MEPERCSALGAGERGGASLRGEAGGDTVEGRRPPPSTRVAPLRSGGAAEVFDALLLFEALFEALLFETLFEALLFEALMMLPEAASASEEEHASRGGRAEGEEGARSGRVFLPPTDGGVGSGLRGVLALGAERRAGAFRCTKARGKSPVRPSSATAPRSHSPHSSNTCTTQNKTIE